MPTRRTFILTLTILLVSSLAVGLLSSRRSFVGVAGTATPGAVPSATVLPATAAPGAQAASSGVLPIEAFSPGFLGVYRKVMEIEDEIVEYSSKYGVDLALARAVCMYESGGNANLSSSAGAQGYFQVMGPTFRALGVPTNIEAGIKYLGQQVSRFGREDYALAAYNGGPTRVARGGAMPLESLQYVLGVGHYRSVLMVHEASVRAHAGTLRLETVREGEDWWGLSRRLGVPLVQLRLHNPFLASRTLTPGNLIAFSPDTRPDLLTTGGDEGLRYETRLGDNYFNVAFTLGADLDLLRTTNGLWRLQSLLPGTVLAIPLDTTAAFTEHRVGAREDLAQIAATLKVDPWSLIRDNALWDEQVREGMVLRVRPAPPPNPAVQTHRVRSGENLTSIARRYATTVRAIQAANSLGRRTLIRIGQRLDIPTK
jgi:LysM repeat protein